MVVFSLYLYILNNKKGQFSYITLFKFLSQKWPLKLKIGLITFINRAKDYNALLSTLILSLQKNYREVFFGYE